MPHQGCLQPYRRPTYPPLPDEVIITFDKASCRYRRRPVTPLGAIQEMKPSRRRPGHGRIDVLRTARRHQVAKFTRPSSHRVIDTTRPSRPSPERMQHWLQAPLSRQRAGVKRPVVLCRLKKSMDAFYRAHPAVYPGDIRHDPASADARPSMAADRSPHSTTSTRDIRIGDTSTSPPRAASSTFTARVQAGRRT